MSQESDARAFEDTMQRILGAAFYPLRVYRSSENVERILPCVVLKARATGEDETFKSIAGRYATAIDFRASSIVSAAGASSAESLELLAARVKTAIESASIEGGWIYIRLDPQGDERGYDGVRREFVQIYGGSICPV